MSTPTRSDERFRPELEGLRGVAILLVVACHAAIPGAEAGFIGVDMFFVLSGFLITGLLVTESERTGRIHLAAFYARRARRILPAAAVVLVVSLVAARAVMSPLDLSRIADDGLAAGLSLANIHFAVSTTDYFAPVDASPLLHFWSLSLEEQFYLFWPALLIIATRFARPRRVMIVLAGIVLIGALLLCVAVTAGAPAWAYYALPTRAWQLAAGGVLALAGAALTRIPWPIAASVGWLGAGIAGPVDDRDRADDALPGCRRCGSHRRHAGPHRGRFGDGLPGLAAAAPAADALARPDLLFALPVALAGTGPRRDGAGADRGRDDVTVRPASAAPGPGRARRVDRRTVVAVHRGAVPRRSPVPWRTPARAGDGRRGPPQRHRDVDRAQ